MANTIFIDQVGRVDRRPDDRDASERPRSIGELTRRPITTTMMTAPRFDGTA